MKKIKTYKRLLNFLRFKRHKRLRLLASAAGMRSRGPHSRIDGATPVRTFILKKDRFKYYKKRVNARTGKRLLEQRMSAYSEHSFIFTILSQFPRRSLFNFLGKDIVHKYYTMPFDPEISRFLASGIIRGYYQNLSAKALKKEVFNKLRCSVYGRSAQTGKGLAGSKGSSHPLPLLERRLDSAALRILQSQPLYTTKPPKEAKKRRKFAYAKRRLKLPLKNFTSSQIRQLINHGHIYINDKKIKSKGLRLQVTDQIKFHAFIKKAFNDANNLKNTLLLRNFDKTLSKLASSEPGQDSMHIGPPPASRAADQGAIINGGLNLVADPRWATIIHYIKHLKVQRYTELFYLTYRNLYLFKRSSSSFFNLEKNIINVYHALGYNQSIFTLWSSLQLLKTTDKKAWQGLALKRVATLQNGVESPKNKKEIQNLLKWKRYLNLLTWSKGSKGRGLSEGALLRSDPFVTDQFLLLAGPQPLEPSLHQILDPKKSKCYASIIYGTKTCKWIKMQQSCTNTKMKRSFYNQMYNKINFFSWELWDLLGSQTKYQI